MLYLLDANILITAHNTYYPIDRVPEFWEWLTYLGGGDILKIPIEIIEEIRAGNKSDDLLHQWIRDTSNFVPLLLNESADPAGVQHVLDVGYGRNLTDDELEQIGRDPFLVSYAVGASDRCIVTNEVSRPRRQRQNRHLPDVCQVLGVQCCNLFQMNTALDFRTNWRS